MEVYLNVAETGIGTYGANAGAQRYFHHGAGQLTPLEAAQIAAVLPLPKKRAAIEPDRLSSRATAAASPRGSAWCSATALDVVCAKTSLTSERQLEARRQRQAGGHLRHLLAPT